MKVGRQGNLARGGELAIAVAITLLATVVVFVDIPNTSKFMHVLHKTGHPTVFGLVAVLVLLLVATRKSFAERPAWARYAVAFVITVVIGAMTEIAQLFTNRGAAVADVVSDAIGAAACLAWHAAIFSKRGLQNQSGSNPVLVMIASLLSLVALAPLLWCLGAYAARDTLFPVILQNPSRLDMYFVSSETGNVSVRKMADSETQQDAALAVRVAINQGRYPGISLTEPYPGWRHFKTLAVDITNPGQQQIELVIRIHDRQHNYQYEDRFNRAFIIGAGLRTTVEIPLLDVEHSPKGRLMNLDAIANLAIFALQPVTDGEFLVHKVWLR